MEETKYLYSLIEVVVTIIFIEGVYSKSIAMENFIGGVCISTSADIPKWGRSYIECLDECRARTECTAVNVHPKLRYCHLNMDNSGYETMCPGFVLSKRLTWTQQNLPGCNDVTCSASQACEVDHGSESPDCVYRECPPIVGPDHSIVLGNQRTIGARIVYACKDGYTLVGNSVRHCTEMGDWSGVLPRCQPDLTTTNSQPATTTTTRAEILQPRDSDDSDDSDEDK